MPPPDPEPEPEPEPEVEVDRAARVALELAGWACARMRTPSTGLRAKAHAADLVTDTDLQIERHVRAVLHGAFPGHGVIGEELGATRSAPGAPTWVVDPVDGTTNFAHGIGWSSFSLGLRDGLGPLVGVVADPWRGEVFSAVRGRGARLGGTPVRASPATGLAGQVVMTEWAAHEPWAGMPALLAELSRRWCTVRIMGSTALSLVQVAAGRAAGAMVGGFHPVDGEPAALIAREAGALALDDAGAPTLAPAGGLLLAAPGVAEELAGLWRSARSPSANTAPARNK